MAQVVPDQTLPVGERSQVSGDANIQIDGGATRGSNLFHSFREFSVPTGGSASFNNAPQIENILTRVTGNSVSNIDGLLRSNGTANLFLLNPNGIIFGANARLDVGGAFVTSTADAIAFPSGDLFSATNPTAPTPLLTIDPNALLFNQLNPQPIINRSIPRSADDAAGLTAAPGQTIALVGGDVRLENGQITALGGRVELGGLSAPGAIGLTMNENILRLAFPTNVARSDVSQVSLGNTSRITVAGGAGGSVAITTRNLNLSNSFIFAGLEVGLGTADGQAGDVEINATGVVNLVGSSIFNNVGIGSTERAGNIHIRTRSLALTSGAALITSTSGRGDAGDIIIEARDTVSFDGRIANGSLVPGGVFSNVGDSGIGRGGDIRISTGTLAVTNGAQLIASTFTFWRGNAGNIIIEARDAVSFDGTFDGTSATGFSSGAFSTVDSTAIGVGGNITVIATDLAVTNGAELSTSSAGIGRAGNIRVNVPDVLLDQGDIASETTAGDGGNIDLTVPNTLLLRRGSSISTSAGTEQAGGNGGNITFNGDFIVAVPSENSDITANAFRGRGGNVDITAQGIFGLEFRPGLTSQSDITASSQFGTAGTVTFNTPDVDPTQGLTALPADVVDASDQIAIGCSPTATAQVNRGEFYQTGRGGIAPSPTDPIASSDILEDLQPPASWSASTEPTAEIVEAQGWQVNDRGEVMLVAATLPNHCGR